MRFEPSEPRFMMLLVLLSIAILRIDGFEGLFTEEDGELWGPWAACSATCGGGDRYRTKMCVGTCVGDQVKIESCNTDPCPEKPCGGTLTSPFGTIQTPNYPNDYPANKNCTWHFEVEEGRKLVFVVEKFDIQASTDCSSDYLEAFQPGSRNVNRYCGTTLIPGSRFESIDHDYFLKFVSDSYTSGKGFLIKYESKSIPVCSDDFCVNDGICSGDHTCDCLNSKYFGYRCLYEKYSISEDKFPLPTFPSDGDQEEGVCSLFGMDHVMTFDKAFGTFTGSCQYVVSRWGSDENVEVLVRRRPQCISSSSSCNKEVSIAVLSQTLKILSDDTILLDGTQVILPMNSGPFRIEKTDWGVVTVKFDEAKLSVDMSHFTITLTLPIGKHVEGLCGNFDGDPGNDNDGRFFLTADKYISNDGGETCAFGSEDDQAVCSTFTSEQVGPCDVLYTSAFSKCRKYVPVTSFYETCRLDACRCNISERADCHCSAVANYARECRRLGYTVHQWRTETLCAASCPANQIYSECGSTCSRPTCSNPSHGTCSLQCGEVCECPEDTYWDEEKKWCVLLAKCPCTHAGETYLPGKTRVQDCNTCTCTGSIWECSNNVCPGFASVSGFSNFHTFDGIQYHYPGRCTYTYAYDCTPKTDRTFAIYIETEECGYEGDFSCLNKVKIFSYLPSLVTSVTLERGGSILVNGNSPSLLPVVAGGISVYSLTSRYIEVIIHHLQVSVLWDKWATIYVTMPPQFQDRVCGLGGKYNAKSADDLTTKDGLTAMVAVFSESWEFASEPCSTGSSKKACVLNSNRASVAEKECSVICSDVFKDCKAVIACETYMEKCKQEACACEGGSNCLCNAVADYALRCAMENVHVKWRSASFCNIDCMGNLTYQIATTTCGRTCRSQMEPESCLKTKLLEGCNCPEDKYLSEDGETCVELQDCPCYYEHGWKDAGHVIHQKSGPCYCINGKIVCNNEQEIDETTELECPSFMDKRLCSNLTQGEQGAECLRTCRNKGEPCPEIQCKSGCVCPNDFVYHNGECLEPSECPCKVHDKEFPVGSETESGCEKIRCTSDGWKVISRENCLSVCEIVGGAYYQTFDNRRFTFRGTCEYLLATDHCSGLLSYDNDDDFLFRVTARNIDCPGSSKAMCETRLHAIIGNFDIYMHKGIETTVKPYTRATRELQAKYQGWIVQNVTLGMYTVVYASSADQKISIAWDGSTKTYIRLSDGLMRGETCGMCGNNNDDYNDDFNTITQNLAVSADDFGNSWKVESSCQNFNSLSVDTCGPRKSWAQEKCSVLYSSAFANCHDVVELDYFFDTCVSETCSCDSGGDCECFCTAVSAYAYACAEAGVLVNWRSPSICPTMCESYNTGSDCVWEYQPCQLCTKFCCVEECFSSCFEGCYPKCPEGTLYNVDTNECLPEGECNCVETLIEVECENEENATWAWTEWMSSNTPSAFNGGEFEQIKHLNSTYNLQCVQARQIDCRSKSNPNAKLPSTVMCATPYGFSCLNSDQDDAECDDYEIRFTCPRCCGDVTCPEQPSCNRSDEQRTFLHTSNDGCCDVFKCECIGCYHDNVLRDPNERWVSNCTTFECASDGHSCYATTAVPISCNRTAPDCPEYTTEVDFLYEGGCCLSHECKCKEMPEPTCTYPEVLHTTHETFGELECVVHNCGCEEDSTTHCINSTTCPQSGCSRKDVTKCGCVISSQCDCDPSNCPTVLNCSDPCFDLMKVTSASTVTSDDRCANDSCCDKYKCVPPTCEKDTTVCEEWESKILIDDGQCCPTYNCSCNKTKEPFCPEEGLTCKEHEDKVKIGDLNGCCNDYNCTCKRCTDETNKMREPSETWESALDHCQIMICYQPAADGVSVCPIAEVLRDFRSECPAAPKCNEYEMLETTGAAGNNSIAVSSDNKTCCPKHKCVCKLCPSDYVDEKPTPKPYEKVEPFTIEENPNQKCCPQWHIICTSCVLENGTAVGPGSIIHATDESSCSYTQVCSNKRKGNDSSSCYLMEQESTEKTSCETLEDYESLHCNVTYESAVEIPSDNKTCCPKHECKCNPCSSDYTAEKPKPKPYHKIVAFTIEENPNQECCPKWKQICQSDTSHCTREECKLHQTSTQTDEVDDKCCPVYSNCTCLPDMILSSSCEQWYNYTCPLLYKREDLPMDSTDPCCPKYNCSCDPDQAQYCEKANLTCKLDETRQKVGELNKCCDDYECKCDKCLDAESNPHNLGTTWPKIDDEECVTMICRQPVVMSRDGCPVVDVYRNRRNKCRPPPTCNKNEILETTAGTGINICCNDYDCVCEKCLYKDSTLEPNTSKTEGCFVHTCVSDNKGCFQINTTSVCPDEPVPTCPEYGKLEVTDGPCCKSYNCSCLDSQEPPECDYPKVLKTSILTNGSLECKHFNCTCPNPDDMDSSHCLDESSICTNEGCTNTNEGVCNCILDETCECDPSSCPEPSCNESCHIPRETSPSSNITFPDTRCADDTCCAKYECVPKKCNLDETVCQKWQKKVSEADSDPCCPKYRCSCSQDLAQHCEDANLTCKANEEKLKVGDLNECCEDFICKCNKCLDEENNPHEIDTTWEAIANKECVTMECIKSNESSSDECPISQVKEDRRENCPEEITECTEDCHVLVHDAENSDACCNASKCVPSCKDMNGCYNNGEEWSDDNGCSNKTCKCNSDDCSTTVTGPYCPGREKLNCPYGEPINVPNPDNTCCPLQECRCDCTVFGDPHYSTFDGKGYSFQGECQYTLVAIKNSDRLHIYSDNYVCRELPVLRGTCLKGLVVKWDDTLVTLTRESENTMRSLVLINGTVQTKLPWSGAGIKITMIGGFVYLNIAEIKLQLTYFPVFLPAVVISVQPSSFYNNSVGLCGTCTYDQDDDFEGKNGSMIEHPTDFGYEWETDDSIESDCFRCDPEDETCECYPEQEKCNKTKCDPDPCESIYNEIFSDCKERLDISSTMEFCHYDSTILGMCKVCNSTTITNFALECQKTTGVCLKWRDALDCKLPPVECPGDLIYKECIDECDAKVTCENKDDFEECTSTEQTNGCFCKDGFIPRKANSYECIPKTETCCEPPDSNFTCEPPMIKTRNDDNPCKPYGCICPKCPISFNCTEVLGCRAESTEQDVCGCPTSTKCICNTDLCPEPPECGECFIPQSVPTPVSNSSNECGNCCTAYQCIEKPCEGRKWTTENVPSGYRIATGNDTDVCCPSIECDVCYLPNKTIVERGKQWIKSVEDCSVTYMCTDTKTSKDPKGHDTRGCYTSKIHNDPREKCMKKESVKCGVGEEVVITSSDECCSTFGCNCSFPSRCPEFNRTTDHCCTLVRNNSESECCPQYEEKCTVEEPSYCYLPGEVFIKLDNVTSKCQPKTACICNDTETMNIYCGARDFKTHYCEESYEATSLDPYFVSEEYDPFWCCLNISCVCKDCEDQDQNEVTCEKKQQKVETTVCGCKKYNCTSCDNCKSPITDEIYSTGSYWNETGKDGCPIMYKCEETDGCSVVNKIGPCERPPTCGPNKHVCEIKYNSTHPDPNSCCTEYKCCCNECDVDYKPPPTDLKSYEIIEYDTENPNHECCPSWTITCTSCLLENGTAIDLGTSVNLTDETGCSYTEYCSNRREIDDGSSCYLMELVWYETEFCETDEDYESLHCNVKYERAVEIPSDNKTCCSKHECECNPCSSDYTAEKPKPKPYHKIVPFTIEENPNQNCCPKWRIICTSCLLENGTAVVPGTYVNSIDETGCSYTDVCSNERERNDSSSCFVMERISTEEDICRALEDHETSICPDKYKSIVKIPSDNKTCCPELKCECNPCPSDHIAEEPTTKPYEQVKPFTIEENPNQECCPQWHIICTSCLLENGTAVELGTRVNSIDETGCTITKICSNEREGNDNSSCYLMKQVSTEKDSCETLDDYQKSDCNVNYEHAVEIPSDNKTCCPKHECECNPCSSNYTAEKPKPKPYHKIVPFTIEENPNQNCCPKWRTICTSCLLENGTAVVPGTYVNSIDETGCLYTDVCSNERERNDSSSCYVMERISTEEDICRALEDHETSICPDKYKSVVKIPSDNKTCCPELKCECNPCSSDHIAEEPTTKPYEQVKPFTIEENPNQECCPQWHIICTSCLLENGTAVELGTRVNSIDETGCTITKICSNEREGNDNSSCYLMKQVSTEKDSCKTLDDYQKSDCNVKYETAVVVPSDNKTCCPKHECECNPCSSNYTAEKPKPKHYQEIVPFTIEENPNQNCCPKWRIICTSCLLENGTAVVPGTYVDSIDETGCSYTDFCSNERERNDSSSCYVMERISTEVDICIGLENYETSICPDKYKSIVKIPSDNTTCCPELKCECNPCSSDHIAEEPTPEPYEQVKPFTIEENPNQECCPQWHIICTSCLLENGTAVELGTRVNSIDETGCTITKICSNEREGNDNSSCYLMKQVSTEKDSCATLDEYEKSDCNVKYETAVVVPSDNKTCCPKHKCECNSCSYNTEEPKPKQYHKIVPFTTQENLNQNCCPKWRQICQNDTSHCIPENCSAHETSTPTDTKDENCCPIYTNCTCLPDMVLSNSCKKWHNYTCSLGYKTEKVMNSDDPCCPEFNCICEKCVLEGAVIPVNNSWTTKGDVCSTSMCALNDGTKCPEVITKEKYDCAPFNATDCILRGGRIATNESTQHCCRHCEILPFPCEKKIETVTLNATIAEHRCWTDQLVDVAYCVGACPTSHMVDEDSGQVEGVCRCCKPSMSYTQDYEMYCDDSVKRTHEHLAIMGCACMEFDCNSPTAPTVFALP